MLGMMAIVFVGTLLIGVPIAFVLAAAAYLPVLIGETVPALVVVQRMITGIDSFPLMAIPFFILAGEIMLACGIAQRLVNFQMLLVGHVRGGLAQVNVLASVLFAGISGSSLADAAGLGKIEIRMMRQAGYDLRFAASVTAASATIGPIIPPSILMVIYAVVEPRVSVGGLFMAGVLPGFLIAGLLMLVCYILSARRGYPVSSGRAPLGAILRGTLNAVVALIMPAIILGGILGGVFTATEAGAVAVCYALFAGFVLLRSLELRAMPLILMRTGVITATVLLIIGAANAVSWLLATQQVPQLLTGWFLALSDDPRVFLLFLNVCLLLIGMVMDITAAMLIFVPVFSPVATSMGIEPLHLATVVIMNLMIGTVTPPLGTVLFVVSAISGLKVEALSRAILPFVATLIVSLLTVTFVPEICLFLPRLLGFLR